jgi:CRP-like cAMP-binding protein
LEQLLDATSTIRAAPGAILFRRGDSGHDVLFLLAGTVVVEADGPGGRAVQLNLAKPAEIIGELAALRDSHRSATVRAVESCELLRIPQSEFLALLVGHPALAIQTLGSVVDRLRNLTDAVVAATPERGTEFPPKRSSYPAGRIRSARSSSL